MPVLTALFTVGFFSTSSHTAGPFGSAGAGIGGTSSTVRPGQGVVLAPWRRLWCRRGSRFRLAFDRPAVLRLQRTGFRRGGDRIGADRAHQRPGHSHACPRDRCGRTLFRQHGHDCLADPQRRQRRFQVVDIGFRVGADGLAERLLIVGSERTQRVLNPRTQLGQHVVGQVRGQLRAEEHPDALGADQLHGLFDPLQKGLGGVGKKQVRLIEEEDQFGLVDVANLGQDREQIGQHPHQERGEDDRTQRLTAELEQRDDAAALVVDAQQIVRVELRLAEEGVAALAGKVDQRSQDDTRRRRRHPAQVFQVGLTRVAGQMADHAAQIVQGHQAAIVFVGPMKDQPQRRLLGSIEPQYLRQKDRTEAGNAGTHRHPDSARAERQKLHRKAARRPVVAGVFRARGGLVVGLPRPGQPGQVALHVGHQHRDTRGAELFGNQLQRLGLAGSRCSGHQTVPVDGGQRDADLRRRVGHALDDDGAQFQCLAVDGVAVRDPPRGPAKFTGR